jgi:hypothetical protein
MTQRPGVRREKSAECRLSRTGKVPVPLVLGAGAVREAIDGVHVAFFG